MHTSSKAHQPSPPPHPPPLHVPKRVSPPQRHVAAPCTPPVKRLRRDGDDGVAVTSDPYLEVKQEVKHESDDEPVVMRIVCRTDMKAESDDDGADASGVCGVVDVTHTSPWDMRPQTPPKANSEFKCAWPDAMVGHPAINHPPIYHPTIRMHARTINKHTHTRAHMQRRVY